MRAKLFLAGLGLFNLAGVLLGYEGIARLRRLQVPPFFAGLGDVMAPYPPPPNWLLLGWASTCGQAILCAGCLLIPVISAALAFGKGRYLSGFTLAFVWTLASGVVGFRFWFDAIFNVPG